MATFNQQISASGDDGGEGSGSVSLSGTNLNANSPTQYIGWRFTNVTIPQGSTINSATMNLNFVSASFDDPNVLFYAEDVDDASAFAETTNNISGRTPTSATVIWSQSSIGTGTRTTPDLKTIIQEIVDRPGWASGNALVPICVGIDSSSFMRVRAYDGTPGDAASITIDYTEPPSGGGSIVPLAAMHYARLRGN